MPNTPISNYSVNKIPKEMYLFFGGYTFANPEEDFNPLFDSFFAKRVPDKNKKLTVRINTWQANKTYKHYSSTTNYDVVWNDENNVVYLCLHNNSNFRDDNEDAEPGLSTEKPSHMGKQTYNDGYTWLSLWKVDFTDYDYVSDGEIPIPSISTEKDYSTFAEKYQPLCGTNGATAFGCCCLYFTENNTDEITGEVYTKGDLTNEIVFSDCFECQKLADTLGRDATFLAGVTVAGISGSNPGENPLCPATKTIKSLQEKIEDDIYNVVPGSAKDFQLQQLKTHNERGIMLVSIDLTGFTEAQRTISVANPTINIVDPAGSNATAALKTNPIGADSHYVYGIELTAEGSDYSLLPTPYNASVSSTILNAINVFPYPEKIYEDTQIYTPATGLRVITSLTNQEIASIIPAVIPLSKAAVILDPKKLADGTPLIKPKNDESTSKLLTEIFAFDPLSFEAGVVAPLAGGAGVGMIGEDLPVFDGDDEAQLYTGNRYVAYSVYRSDSQTKNVQYGGVSGAADGYTVAVNDDPNSIQKGSKIIIDGITHIAYNITVPVINAKSATFYDAINFTDNPIGITSALNQTTLKSYVFNIKLDI